VCVVVETKFVMVLVGAEEGGAGGGEGGDGAGCQGCGGWCCRSRDSALMNGTRCTAVWGG
jgi:hypothetical protein